MSKDDARSLKPLTINPHEHVILGRVAAALEKVEEYVPSLNVDVSGVHTGVQISMTKSVGLSKRTARR